MCEPFDLPAQSSDLVNRRTATGWDYADKRDAAWAICHEVMPTAQSDSRIPVATETRENVLRPLLRRGQTWDSLLRAMAEQYDPDATWDENHEP